LILAVSERVEEGQGLALRRQADEIIAEVLAEYQLPHDAVDAARVRRAMCVVLGCRIAPFAGAAELLAGIRGLGLHCIIVSNTTFRDRHAYQRDFDLLGWTPWIDHIVTSIDVGHFKPARQMFDASLQAARCQPSECVMVGDSETADIEPASALGMRTLRVAIEHPLPKASCADAVVDSLGVALSVLTNWAISRQ
jgi:FMN phosphatase YigB (HAD superfamily)